MKNTAIIFFVKLFLPASLLLILGCATVMYTFDDMPVGKPLVYGGTQHHVRELKDMPNKRYRAERYGRYDMLVYKFSWWHYLDFPLSFAADTLILPYTVPRTLYLARKRRGRRLPPDVAASLDEHRICVRVLKDLASTREAYISHYGLTEEDRLPGSLEAYKDFMVKSPGDFYTCPAGGVYTPGGWGKEPSCSVHGTVEQARENIGFLIRKHRKPRKDE